MITRTVCRAALILLAGTLACRAAAAEGEIDRFLLPETPPTIERIKKAPLDQPRLRKQDFISPAGISLPPVLLTAKFRPFGAARSPVEAGFWSGSFASSGGHFLFAAPQGFSLDYRTSSAGGETERLARTTNLFAAGIERELAPGMTAKGSLSAEEATVWTQAKNFYRGAASIAWYAAEGLKTEAGVSFEKGEVGAGENESLAGTLNAAWQPLDGHAIALSLLSRKDTAFPGQDELPAGELTYHLSVTRPLVLGGGYAYRQGRLFPRADAIVFPVPRVRMKLAYEPGIDRLSWRELYGGDSFVSTRPLSFPEASFRLRESVSYYLDEEWSAELEFRQARWERYLAWEQPAGETSRHPVLIPDVTTDECRFTASYQRAPFSATASLGTLNADLPFAAGIAGEASAEYRTGGWTFGAGYVYTGERSAVRDRSVLLPAAGTVAARITYRIEDGIELSCAGSNLLGERVEPQPGFVRTAPEFKAGVTVSF